MQVCGQGVGRHRVLAEFGSVKGSEWRMQSRAERAWWRMYTAMKWLAEAGITLEASSMLYIMDKIAQDEHLRKGVDSEVREGATREEVLQ